MSPDDHRPLLGDDPPGALASLDAVGVGAARLASLERFAKYVMPEFTEEKMAERAKKAPSSNKGGPEAPPMPQA